MDLLGAAELDSRTSPPRHLPFGRPGLMTSLRELRGIMGAFSVGSLAVGALALLWLALAAVIAVIAARRYRLAPNVLDTARAHSRLLELIPSRPLVGRAAGRIEGAGSV